MNLAQPLRRGATLVALAAACACAQAAPVELSYSGSVSGYTFGDLSGFAPLGTTMSLQLSFNDTFSDGTYAFSDDSGPISGVMQLGSASYTFDDYTPQSYSYDGATGQLLWVGLQFLGTGPAPAGAELFGLFVRMTPQLTLLDPMRLGFGFTTSNGDLTVTNYRYLDFTGSGSIQPVGTVPLPSSMALAAAALLALALSGRARAVGPASA